MMNVDPAKLIELIRNGKNPQQLMMHVLEDRAYTNNPVMMNLLELAKENRTSEIEQVARNLYAERGLDFDSEFNSFKQKFGL
jgi:hypothetical protein